MAYGAELHGLPCLEGHARLPSGPPPDERCAVLQSSPACRSRARVPGARVPRSRARRVPGGRVRRGEIAQTVSRGGFYITVEQMAGLVSGIVYTVVVLRWLGPYAYGVLALAMALAGLATIGAGNFEMFLERYAAEYQARGEYATLAR